MVREQQGNKISRRQLILNFIRQNEWCTKTEVIKYMDGSAEGNKSPVHAALMTTVKIIDDLITGEDKLIIMKKDPKNSQVHRLHLNDNNQFNLIDKELTEIENSIDILNEPMDKIRQLRFPEFYIGSKEFSELREYFEFPYRNSFGTMFLLLLIRTNDKIRSENDLKILYGRIFELMIKLNRQTFDLADTRDILSSLVRKLERLQGLSSLEAYAKEHDVNIMLGNNLIARIRNFQKRFLN